MTEKPAPRKRGRPKGSKNKPKPQVVETGDKPAVIKASRASGGPGGSRNKAKSRGVDPKMNATQEAQQFLHAPRLWDNVDFEKRGRPHRFENPQQLWNEVKDYFEWCENNPLWEGKLVSYQGKSKLEKVPLLQVMTITGLCARSNISERTWRAWKDSNNDLYRPDLIPVIDFCEETIRNQKFSGAAVDLFNSNIISRDLGLADKASIDHSNPDGSMQGNVTINLNTTKAGQFLPREVEHDDEMSEDERAVFGPKET